MISNVDVESSQVQSSKGQKALVWVGLILGVVLAVGGSLVGQTLSQTLGFILIGFGFLFPSLWWMHCETEDRKNIQHYEDTMRANEDLSRYLADSEKHLLEGVAAPLTPRMTDRRWPLIALASIGLMVLGALVASASPGTGDSGIEKKSANVDKSEPSDSSLIRADDPAEKVSSESSNAGKLQEALSLSDKPDNDVYLTIHEMTLGEECKYGELLDDLQPGFQYLQLTADFDVQKLGSPTYDLGEMLAIPRTIDSEGFTKEAGWAASCMPSAEHDQWNVILTEGEKARVYGAFVVPENTEVVEIQNYEFDME